MSIDASGDGTCQLASRNDLTSASRRLRYTPRIFFFFHIGVIRIIQGGGRRDFHWRECSVIKVSLDTRQSVDEVLIAYSEPLRKPAIESVLDINVNSIVIRKRRQLLRPTRQIVIEIYLCVSQLRKNEQLMLSSKSHLFSVNSRRATLLRGDSKDRMK